MPTQNLNLPNVLTGLRIVLIPVFAYFFLRGQYDLALLVFLIAGMTDLVDGTIARFLKERTRLGAILDPAADKLLMTTSYTILTIRGFIPLWLTVLVILRDLYIVIGVGILKKLKRSLYFRPIWLSKANTGFQLLLVLMGFLLAYLLQGSDWLTGLQLETFQQLFRLCIYVVAFFTLASGIGYTKMGLDILRGKRDYVDLSYQEGKNHRQ